MAALPAVRACSPELPEHPDYTRILAVFNEETGTLRAKDVANHGPSRKVRHDRRSYV